MVDPYKHIDLGVDSSGRPMVINARTQAMLHEVEQFTGEDVTIVQGSYMGDESAAASGSTHDGGGVIDIRTKDYTDQERDEVLRALREIGFAAWYRTPEEGFDYHIHAVAIGDKEMDPSAQAQVEDYKNGLDGLSDHAPDDGPQVPFHVFHMGDTLGPADAFDATPGRPVTAPAQDSDHDMLTDEFERLLGTDPHAADSDHDGLSDFVETTQTHTDPLSADTNADGITDAKQVGAHAALHGSAGEAAIPDKALAAGFGGGATIDRDSDGLSDLAEYQLGSDATQADTDHDGVSDSIEERLGSDLTNIDSDHDGITDSAELHQGTLTGDPADELPEMADAGDDGHLGH